MNDIDLAYVRLAAAVLESLCNDYLKIRCFELTAGTEARKNYENKRIALENVIRSQHCQSLAMGSYEPDDVIKKLNKKAERILRGEEKFPESSTEYEINKEAMVRENELKRIIRACKGGSGDED